MRLTVQTAAEVSCRALGSTLIMIHMIRLLLIALICFLAVVTEARVDCCLADNNAFGISCESGAYIDGTIYYCVTVSKSCSSCQLNSTVISKSNECNKCCVAEEDACEVTSDTTVTNTSWGKCVVLSLK